MVCINAKEKQPDTDLLTVAQASEEERHAQDQQQVGQDGAKERGLDDANLILDERNAVKSESVRIHGAIKTQARCR